MSVIDAALEELGRSMGIDQLSFSDEGHVCLNIESFGDLHLEREDEMLAMYLARSFDFSSNELLKNALMYCHYDNRNSMDITAGLEGEGNLAFICRFEVETATLPNMQEALNLLQAAHTKMETFSR